MCSVVWWTFRDKVTRQTRMWVKCIAVLHQGIGKSCLKALKISCTVSFIYPRAHVMYMRRGPMQMLFLKLWNLEREDTIFILYVDCLSFTRSLRTCCWVATNTQLLWESVGEVIKGPCVRAPVCVFTWCFGQSPHIQTNWISFQSFIDFDFLSQCFCIVTRFI